MYISILSNISTNVIGNSFSDPILADIGENVGYFSGIDSVYLWFLATGTFIFSLNGPGGSNFDMTIYDGNRNILSIATGTNYPDEVIASSSNTFYIRVYGAADNVIAGPFSVTISEAPDIDSIEYYNEFSIDDTFEWRWTQIEFGTQEEFSWTISMEILQVPLIDNFDIIDYLFRKTIRGHNGTLTTDQDNAEGLLLPTKINYINGTSIEGLENILINVYKYSTICEDDTCTITNGENIYEYDELTGILKYCSFVFDFYLSTYEVEIKLTTDLDKFYEGEESSFISFNSFFGIFILVILPILRVKRRK